MKLAILSVGLLAFAGSPSAQNAPQREVRFTADSITEVGSVWQLIGNVQVRLDSSVATAREGDVTRGADGAPERIVLRGNVRITQDSR
jgi:hypothetical protein